MDLNQQITSLQLALRRLKKTHSNECAQQLQEVNSVFQVALQQLNALNAASSGHTECLQTFVVELGGDADDSTVDMEEATEEIDDVDPEEDD